MTSVTVINTVGTATTYLGCRTHWSCYSFSATKVEESPCFVMHHFLIFLAQQSDLQYSLHFVVAHFRRKKKKKDGLDFFLLKLKLYLNSFNNYHICPSKMIFFFLILRLYFIFSYHFFRNKKWMYSFDQTSSMWQTDSEMEFLNGTLDFLPFFIRLGIC